MKKFLGVAFCAALATTVCAQSQSRNFRTLATRMPAEWYATADARAVADSCLKYQFPSGGWAKNQNWHETPTGKALKERMDIVQEIKSEKGIGATIDNNATTSEMLLLAKVYANSKQKKYKKAFLKGVDYLLEAQYDNGGWPQFYPFKPFTKEGAPFYSNHITFNDNAMYNVMVFLRDVANNQEPFAAMKLPAKLVEKMRQAYNKGIDCILKTQVVIDGKRTVWCQQHDERTLLPAPARSFELVSLTGNGETPNLLKLLMDVENPSQEIIDAVKGAVEWLEKHALVDVKLESFTNKDGKRDRRLVHAFGHRMWARYYDMETGEPFVCDRDGVKQPGLEYIGYERRNGYSWYGTEPEAVLKAFPKWLKKVSKE